MLWITHFWSNICGKTVGITNLVLYTSCSGCSSYVFFLFFFLLNTVLDGRGNKMHVKSTDCNVYSNKPNNRLWWLTIWINSFEPQTHTHGSTACTLHVRSIAFEWYRPLKEHFTVLNILFTRLIFKIYLKRVEAVNKFTQFNANEHKHLWNIVQLNDAFFSLSFAILIDTKTVVCLTSQSYHTTPLTYVFISLISKMLSLTVCSYHIKKAFVEIHIFVCVCKVVCLNKQCDNFLLTLAIKWNFWTLFKFIVSFDGDLFWC